MFFAKPLTPPVTWPKAGSAAGLVPVGGAGGCSSLSVVSGAGPSAGAAAPAAAPTGARHRRRPCRRRADHRCRPTPLRPWHRPCRAGWTAGTGFAGGTAFFAGTDAGPNPVLVTASAEAGGFGPSRSTGTPAALAAFNPFSTMSIAGSFRRISVSAESISVSACSPGDRSFAAIRAPAAGLPSRWTGNWASSPEASAAAAPPPACRRPAARASTTSFAADSIDGDPVPDRPATGAAAGCRRPPTMPATAAFPALRCSMANARGFINAADRWTVGACCWRCRAFAGSATSDPVSVRSAADFIRVARAEDHSAIPRGSWRC